MTPDPDTTDAVNALAERLSHHPLWPKIAWALHVLFVSRALNRGGGATPAFAYKPHQRGEVQEVLDLLATELHAINPRIAYTVVEDEVGRRFLFEQTLPQEQPS